MLFLTQDHTQILDDTLYNLITNGNWKLVTKTVIANKGKAAPYSSPCCHKCKSTHSPLLLTCKLNPPLKVIDTLLKDNASAAMETDCIGRLPLHVACEYSASTKVIRRILIANKKAVSAKDRRGMLPLHLLCRFYSRNAPLCKIEESVEKSMKKILKTLIEVRPKTILKIDNEGMCPIEHAIMSHASVGILNELIKRSTQERMRNQATQAEQVAQAA